MMRSLKLLAGLLLLHCLVPAFYGCRLVREKKVDLVLTSEICADFAEDHDSEIYDTPQYIGFYESLDDFLAGEGITNIEVKRAMLASVSYTVTDFEHPQHGWLISGEITVERADINDGPVPFFEYAELSVAGALGVDIPAPLDTAGVDLINRALADYIVGGTPQLIFKITSSDVEPDPSYIDRIVFGWKTCLVMQLVTVAEFEIVDP